MTKNIVKTHFNNLTKQPNFPGQPGAAGAAPSRAAKNHQDQIRGERPGPGGILATVTVMAARKEQGGQHGQQRKKIFHGSLTCWRICLSVPVAGLAGTAGSGVIPYTIDQQAGREFAIQAVCLAQFRLKSRDFGPGLVELPLQIPAWGRGTGFPQHGAVLVIQPLRPDIGKIFQDRWQMLPEVFLAFLGKPLAELLGIDPNDFTKF